MALKRQLRPSRRNQSSTRSRQASLRQESGEAKKVLAPKLRMISNGKTLVNVLRSEHNAALAIPGSEPDLKRVPQMRGEGAKPVSKRVLPKSARRGRLTAPPNALVNVFVELRVSALKAGSSELVEHVPGQTARRETLVSATLPVRDLDKVAKRPEVAQITPGERIVGPEPTVASVPARRPTLRSTIRSPKPHKKGAGVLIGIIDVGGFDFSHREFLDESKQTRFVRIWDQGGSARPTPFSRSTGRFKYGAEFLKRDLDRAIDQSSRLRVPPWEIERQSQVSPSSHGTHVASVAAGKTGLCPNAFLAGVLVALPEADLDRRTSFYDSTRLAHAVEYLLDAAAQLGNIPVSINISLGTNGHAHDASKAMDRWIDAALSVPGRSVCVAAGNAGQEVSQFEGDTGYVMGRIHTSGRIPARNLHNDIEWVVVGNGIADLSENELEVWYGAQDRFSVSVKPPGGDWIGPIAPRQFIENRQLADKTFLSIYNELYHPSNGSNYIAVYLSPFLNTAGVVGVRAGTWTVRLHGTEVRDGHYHGWIERDDPRPLGRIGEKDAWNFPSFFSERSNVDESSVSSLACGQRIISVANLDEAREQINISSSEGPTRDRRFKPEVAAPGTNVVAANGFVGPDSPWIAMTGTSMASPYVTGVAGLMLAIDPTLDAGKKFEIAP